MFVNALIDGHLLSWWLYEMAIVMLVLTSWMMLFDYIVMLVDDRTKRLHNSLEDLSLPNCGWPYKDYVCHDLGFIIALKIYHCDSRLVTHDLGFIIALKIYHCDARLDVLNYVIWLYHDACGWSYKDYVHRDVGFIIALKICHCRIVDDCTKIMFVMI